MFVVVVVRVPQVPRFKNCCVLLLYKVVVVLTFGVPQVPTLVVDRSVVVRFSCWIGFGRISVN